MGEQQQASPWARPAGAQRAVPMEAAQVGEATESDGRLAAWRAAAAATADPRWAKQPCGPGLSLPEWEWQSAGDDHRPGAAYVSEGERGAPVRGAPVGDEADPASARSAHRARHTFAALCPPLVVVAGGAAVIGSTMTWATVHAFGLMEFAVRGTDPDQHGHLTILLGILAMAAGLLLAGRRVDWGRMLAAVAGLMLAVTAVVDVARLRAGGVLVGSGIDATVDLGPGLFVVGASGVVLVLVGVLVRYTTLVRGADPPTDS
ncbi:hypothetical protein CcI49_08755 [Frankia sp. CcI49]|uniref:hypothetical protein n=1 Tax=unclassified Frankia TaxID=2632575 RepID=UPI0006CA0E30|nr:MULTISPECIES: hypothetical protein [unclassified Frankia]KPM55241.1 hypothetical protein ACG83_16490 [Frankia sp. R43]ONH61213.1 hypothetical protein CcI49_08755 [Frankia sp. CcI49]